MFKKFNQSASARIAAIMLAIGVVGTQTPAHAQNTCYGCNVIDRGMFGSITGSTVYYQGQAATAVSVNRQNGQVLISFSNGASGWVSGRQVYTPRAEQERVIAVFVGACLLTGACTGSKRATGSGRGYDSHGSYRQQESRNHDAFIQYQNQQRQR
jgi:hypothetical protein